MASGSATPPVCISCLRPDRSKWFSTSRSTPPTAACERLDPHRDGRRDDRGGVRPVVPRPEVRLRGDHLHLPLGPPALRPPSSITPPSRGTSLSATGAPRTSSTGFTPPATTSH